MSKRYAVVDFGHYDYDDVGDEYSEVVYIPNPNIYIFKDKSKAIRKENEINNFVKDYVAFAKMVEWNTGNLSPIDKVKISAIATHSIMYALYQDKVEDLDVEEKVIISMVLNARALLSFIKGNEDISAQKLLQIYLNMFKDLCDEVNLRLAFAYIMTHLMINEDTNTVTFTIDTQIDDLIVSLIEELDINQVPYEGKILSFSDKENLVKVHHFDMINLEIGDIMEEYRKEEE